MRPTIDNAHLKTLEARLPELEWRLSSLPILPLPHQLPKGLFQDRLEFSSRSFVDEIKADLRVLSQQDNERSAYYLASRVSQKINVLVRFCQQHKTAQITQSAAGFGVQALSTRQQWLVSLREELQILHTQRQALKGTLLQFQNKQNSQALLNLQIELGELERTITLAEENLARATA